MSWHSNFVRRQDMIRFGTYLKPRYMKPKQTPEYRKISPDPVQGLAEE